LESFESRNGRSGKRAELSEGGSIRGLQGEGWGEGALSAHVKRRERTGTPSPGFSVRVKIRPSPKRGEVQKHQHEGNTD